MELLRIDSKPLHKQCFKCSHCNGILVVGKFAALEGRYYCKPHFKQLFALKGNYSDGFQLNSPVDDKKQTLNSSPTSVSASSPIEVKENGFVTRSNTVGESDVPQLGKLSTSTTEEDSNSKGSPIFLNPMKKVHNIEEEPDTPGQKVTVDTQNIVRRSVTSFERGADSPKQSPRSSKPTTPKEQSPVMAKTNTFDSHKVQRPRSSMISQSSSEDAKDAQEMKMSTSTVTYSTSFQNMASPTRHDQEKEKPKSIISPVAVVGNQCIVCAKTVYQMEQIVVEGVLMHRTCLKCSHCNGVIKLGNFAALDGKFYCKPHFKQLFALKGNYNEGFGTSQHKYRWKPTTQTPTSSDKNGGADINSGAAA